ncbi:putative membrane protein [Kribbella sp. VKM Ac-2571]|uniref:TMEM175 family protein n=1 Tax=Kribbella sp. VKM Ac-2571 TaxID=2512222 RepID=UPI0010E00E67|nr:TMEM175 family protein [Kribbella sp. VKM Ac-2571]TDO56049.1 putative membrane protein [Kribbella sp. VKM Ac-2571]
MSRDPDRLVLFSDAVVAIAITLLVLPLVDLVPEVKAEGGDAFSVISEHRQEIFTFLLSFVVIASFWLGHHRLFEHVRAYTPAMMRVNLLWLLTIVVLPFPTEIVGAFDSDQFTAGLYIGTILALSVCQSVLTWMVRGHKELESPDNPIGQQELVGSLLLTGLTVLAYLLASLVPGVNFYAMLLLLLSPIFMRVWKGRSRSRTGAQQSD